ncbi:HNH endonuclease signature motif containing protein [Microbacterium sp. GXF0217]
MAALSDSEILTVFEESAELVKQVEQIRLLSIGVIAVRSKRSRGHSGLAQSRGQRSTVDLVQKVTGSTKGEAAREVRVGQTLIEEVEARAAAEAGAEAAIGAEFGMGAGARGVGIDGAGGTSGGDDDRFVLGDGFGGSGGTELGRDGDETSGDPGADDADQADSAGVRSGSTRSLPWQTCLHAALQAARITSAQFDVIRSGLGEPPRGDDASDDAARDEWRCAAEQLIAEAGERTVEELRVAARSVRDILDPEGAAERYRAQFEARSFRTYRDTFGRKHGHFVFDEESGAFVDSVLASALRPRRGGPRFVDSVEKVQASQLVDDPRTNDQLAFDLIVDALRAGVLAEPENVFGTRQAGVRLVQTVDQAGARSNAVLTEDGLIAFPAAVADQRICDTGAVTVTVDSCGNPLDVGRDRRLFTSAQRIALAVRDGGCRFPGCDRPASYCEAHHIDEWSGGGRTDIDRGILLCRFHHMNLHHGGWRITREGKGGFVLYDPGGEMIVLKPRAVLLYSWGALGVDPPPKRFRPAA